MTLVSDLLNKFINVPYDQIDEEINNTLRFLAKHLGNVDRCTLFLFSPDYKTITNTHEWVKDDVYSQIKLLQNIPVDMSTFYTNLFLWGENLNPTPAEKTIKPKSEIFIQIKKSDKLIGALGLGTFKKARSWSGSDMSFLTLIGEIIVSAIQRKEMETALFKSEKYYRSIMKSIPIGLFVFRLQENGDLIFVDSNPAGISITGESVVDQYGKTMESAFIDLVRLGVPTIAKKIAVEGGEWSSDEVPIEIGGNDLVFQITTFQTAPNEVATALVDVTQRREMERVIEEENQKLKEIDRMRTDFITTTTHELKTPLVSLLGASEFLLMHHDEMDETEETTLMQLLYRGASRLKMLIDDLLAIYRVESGRFTIEKKDVDLCEIVRSVVNDTDFFLKQREQELELDIPEACPVNVDSIKINQVITNLINNACKNTPTGGKISVSVVSDGQEFTVAVKDSGVGITGEEMPQLFQKFGKLSREDVTENIDIQGTGLGLYISKEIVENHGGTIRAESAGRNEGATFSFTIPVRHQSVEEPRQDETSGNAE